MSTLAVAALPVSHADARSALGEPIEGDDLFDTPFGPVRLEALDGGVKLHLGLDFGDEPERFGLAVRLALGDVVDALERVFVFPDVARPEASSYDALVAEVGEGGEWARVASEEEAEAALEDDEDEDEPNDLFGALQAMMGGAMMGQVQAAVQGGGNDLASLAAQLMGNADLRAAIQDVGQKLMASGALEGIDPNEDLVSQAQRLAGRLAQDSPELLEGLAEKARGGGAANDDEEEP